MPVYDYLCDECGPREFHRAYDDRDKPLCCDSCDSMLRRVWLSAPRQSVVSSHTRHAMSTNERASNEPRMSRDMDAARGGHPPGCGCCSTGKSLSTVTAANGAKSFPTKRPWMISH